MPSLILNGKKIGGSPTNINMDLENLYRLDYDNKVDIKDEIFNENTFTCSKCGIVSISFNANSTNGLIQLKQHGYIIFYGQIYNSGYNYHNQCIVDESEITVVGNGDSSKVTINEAYFIPFLEINTSDASNNNISNTTNYIMKLRNPDYSTSGCVKQMTASGTPYTCPEDGVIIISRFCAISGEVFLRINDINIFSSNSTDQYFGGVIPVSSGDIISFSDPGKVNTNTRISFFKNK